MRSIALFVVVLSSTSAFAASPPDFDGVVAPLLVKRCLGCHSGSEPKGDLDLTKKANAPVTPGKPSESALWKRVESDEMPPKNPLSAEEKALLKNWIEGGAKWGTDPIRVRADPKEWWSFKPIQKPVVPKDQSPIDYFLAKEHKAKGLTPTPLADKRTLIRRVYFDLIGLPPTPEQIQAFEKSEKPDAYEKLIEELLASPQYGERWARHWLDVVHFGETHGYDKDQPRPNAWPYRDYVIRAFNADTPYGKFVQEQIAGDVLYPGTVDGIEALGFLSAGPWDFIGHAELPESKLDGKVARHLDRDDFVANTVSTFLSLTAHCAQCHDHKFDPIAQKEYYGLQAIFAAIDRTDRSYDTDPIVLAKRGELDGKRKALEAKLTSLEATARKQSGKELIELEKRIVEARNPVGPQKPEFGYHSALAEKTDAAKWVQVDLGKSFPLDRVVLHPCFDEFNDIGAGFGFPVRYKVELSEEAEFKSSTLLIDRTGTDQPNPGTSSITIPTNGKSGRYLRITATKLANRLKTDFMLALAEVEAFDAEGKNLATKAVVTALDSIEAPVRWQKSNLTDGIYPPSKISADELAKWNAKKESLLTASLSTEAQTERANALSALAAIRKELQELPKSSRTAFIGAIHTGTGNFVGTGANGGKPRPIHLLNRGEITKPGAEVSPSALAALPMKFELPGTASDGERRAALAKWLTHKDNPLLWRSIVNRVWQYHFGRGLVDTPNDFGRMGQLPTHPELLDFLASEFRDGGGSLKALHKKILMSEAYRRSSASIPNNENLDSDNRFLWRQNRRKLEAEAVRDSMLFVAGKLDLKMGGPSFQDFVVEKPEHSPHYRYDLHDPEDAKSHRRAIYRFAVRSQPQPFLAALDCADPNLSVEKRNQSISPQQALALLNNKLGLAMAKHFASRVENLAANDAGRVKLAFQLAIGREPTASESDVLVKHVKEFGLPSACRVIWNLNEFAFVD